MKNFTISTTSDLLPRTSFSTSLKVILAIIWMVVFSMTVSFSQTVQSVPTKIPCLKLSLTNNECTDETVVRFGSVATDGFDNNFDMYKLDNDGRCPMISSMIEDVNYSINSMPLDISENNNKVVSLVVTGKAGAYTISAIQLTSFEDVAHIYIKDNVNNTVQDLKTNPVYKYNKTSADAQDRLSLVFVNTTVTGVETAELSGVKMEDLVSIRAEKIIINRSKLSASSTLQLELYNSIGEQVFAQGNIGNDSEENYQIQTSNIPSGVYIVKAAYQNKVISKKVYFN